jgi:hypothetical protein
MSLVYATITQPCMNTMLWRFKLLNIEWFIYRLTVDVS